LEEYLIAKKVALIGNDQ